MAAMSSSPIRALLAELWQSRLLIDALTRRELGARYRSSALGYLWTLLNPLILLAVYSLVFAVYMRIDIERYVIFMFAGLLPWVWFQSALGGGATVIVRNAALVTRSCFAPQALPAVEVAAAGVNFLLSLPVLVVFAALLGIWPSPALAALPLLVAAQLVFVYGLALAASALTVFYRDVQFLVGHFLTFFMFLTPLLYPVDRVPASFRWVVARLNPLSPFILAYQDMFWARRFPDLLGLGLALLYAGLALWLGLVVFSRFRWALAEEI